MEAHVVISGSQNCRIIGVFGSLREAISCLNTQKISNETYFSVHTWTKRESGAWVPADRNALKGGFLAAYEDYFKTHNEFIFS